MSRNQSPPYEGHEACWYYYFCRACRKNRISVGASCLMVSVLPTVDYDEIAAWWFIAVWNAKAARDKWGCRKRRFKIICISCPCGHIGMAEVQAVDSCGVPPWASDADSRPTILTDYAEWKYFDERRDAFTALLTDDVAIFNEEICEISGEYAMLGRCHRCQYAMMLLSSLHWLA